MEAAENIFPFARPSGVGIVAADRRVIHARHLFPSCLLYKSFTALVFRILLKTRRLIAWVAPSMPRR